MTSIPTTAACPFWCDGGHASSPADHFGGLDDHYSQSVRVHLEHSPAHVGVTVALCESEVDLDAAELDDLIRRLEAARAALAG